MGNHKPDATEAALITAARKLAEARSKSGTSKTAK